MDVKLEIRHLRLLAAIAATGSVTEAGKRLHRVVDDLVVHGSTAGRVWVADQGGKGSVVAAGVEKGFETAGTTAEIVDGADVGGEGGHSFSLRAV